MHGIFNKKQKIPENIKARQLAGKQTVNLKRSKTKKREINKTKLTKQIMQI